MIFDGHPVIYEPIAFGAHTDPMRRESVQHGHVWGSPDSVASTLGNGDLKLYRGQLLVNASKKATMVQLHGVKVHIRKGTTALLNAQHTSWTIQILNGVPNSACFVHTSGHRFEVGVGQEIRCVTDGATRPELARRRVQQTDEGDGSIEVAEFAFSSLVANNRMLQGLLRASGQIESSLARQMLKSAAALHLVTSSHGAFK